MMKKIYQIPETYIFEKMVVASPLAASGEPDVSNRQAEGTPTTQDGGSLPKGVGETGDNPDPFGGHGQDGNTTRAKMWDDTWDLPQWWNF